MYTYSATEQLVRPNRVLFDQSQEIAIFTKWRETGSKRLHQQIILNYLPIVYKVARAMDGYTKAGSGRIERDELISEGMTGLCDAANRFDITMGWRFSTYARSWVRGVVYAFIAKNFFSVNPCNSSTRKKMFFRLRSMIYKDKKTLGSFEIDQSMAEMLAKSFDTKPQEVMDMLSMFRAPQESLSETVGMGTDSPDVVTRQDMLIDPVDRHAVFNQEDQDKFRQRVILKAVQKLEPREQKIYMSQMVREDDEILTLQDLGDQFGISKERVRQLRDRSSTIVAKEIQAMVERGEIERTDLFG